MIRTTIETTLKDSFAYPLFQRLRRLQWALMGRSIPPPNIIKQQEVRTYAKKYGTRILVETGTFRGDMISACRDSFDLIHSIELSDHLYQLAKKRFAGLAHVHLHLGDSGEVLPIVLERIVQPTLFWLDAHGMGMVHTARGDFETPIIAELQSILSHSHRQHVILIDDARFFIGQNDYPDLTLVEQFVNELRPDMSFNVRDDIIRITPGEAAVAESDPAT